MLNYIFIHSMMQSITFQDLKTKGSKAISDAEVQYLVVNSKMKSVIVPIELYNSLMEAMEELEDIKSIEERKDEKSIPFKGSFAASI